MISISLGGIPEDRRETATRWQAAVHNLNILRCHMLFFVEAYADDHKLTAATDTAKKAFAEAIDWHLVKRFTGVTISDGIRSYSISEFSSAMALMEMAETT